MASSDKKYIVFAVAGQVWAMPLRLGSSFANCENISRVPGAPDGIVGLCYLGGKIITILDTIKIIGSSKSYQDEQNSCLLFDYELDAFALLIDKGMETIDAPRRSLDKSKKIFQSYISYNNSKVYILDPEKIWQVVKIYGSQ